MVEFVGLIKVNVVKGTNLAIRDIVTSDPYVILSLGHQVSVFMSKLLNTYHNACKGKCNIRYVTFLISDLAVGENACHKEQFKSCLE